MAHVTIARVVNSIKTTKFGDKLSVGLKIKETEVVDINGTKVPVNDRFLNAWFNPEYKFEPKEGDVVDILVSQRGDYLDFKLPGVGKPPAPDMSAIIERIAKLEAVVYREQAGLVTVSDPADEPEAVDPDNY